MNKNEELLQRCFDADLNDDEMQQLFSTMSKNQELRGMYRELQSLHQSLQMVSTPNVPHSLDLRMTKLMGKNTDPATTSRPILRQIISKKITFTVPAIAAAILLMMLGSYVAAVNLGIRKPQREYVYVVEMQPVVIQSNYTN